MKGEVMDPTNPAAGALCVIDRARLDDLSAQARTAPRLRKNFNLHASEAEPCNRLLNALEPGTYVPPHRHLDPAKDETMVMVRGRMGVLVFDEAGRVTSTAVLEAGGACAGVNIPHGLYHSNVVWEPGTVVFEAKAGPFRPLLPAEKAPWAPPEGAPESAAYLRTLLGLFPAS
jgi:cupin fold WbuC family metalloprotein